MNVPALPDITARIAEVRARAGAHAFLAVTLPSSFDPTTLLADPLVNHVVASYERPDRGLALVGVGEAGRVDLRAGEPPRVARQDARALLAAYEGAPHAALRPRLLGGFSFDAQRTPSGPWDGFPAGSLVLPRLLFVRDAGTTGVVVAPGVDPSEMDRLVRWHAAPPPVSASVRIAHDVDRQAWLTSVAAVARDIRDGRYEKAVLAGTREIASDATLSLGAALARLRADYTHCHIFTISQGGATFLGASPELLVGLTGGVVSALGLAGSAPRSPDPAEDDRLGRELLASTKNRVEHDIVVRTLRADLEPVTSGLNAAAEPGLLRLRNIQHLYTDVSGRARAGVDILELVSLLHPRPAVCGWPTATALEVIRRHETFDRGWYAGPVGWIDASGDGEFALALRSALVRDRRAWLFAGAGIMGDSVPEAELAEIEWKFTPLSSALAGGGGEA